MLSRVAAFGALWRSSLAAGGQSIFKLGDQVDEKAWDVMWMYFVVFVVTIGFEVLVHWLHHTVTSESGSAVVHHVTQEVMILGGISAALIVFENLGGAQLIDAALFHYVHFVIFLMMILFIFLVSSLFAAVRRSWDKWARFEAGLEDILSDPSLEQEQQCAFLKQYVNHIPNGKGMAAAITFFRQGLPERLQRVSFARYMMKQERKFLLSFIHLHPKSWVLLGALCLAAACATEITILISDNELAIVSQWIVFVGLGPIIVILVVYYKVKSEFRQFVLKVQVNRAQSQLKPSPQTRHFWRRQPAFTVAIVQTMLHYQVFFLANAVTNFSYRLGQVLPLGPPIMVLMFILPLFVFLVLLPVLLPPFTVLASLGELLDHKTLIKMVSADKSAGMQRRIWYRDTNIVEPALFLAEGRRRYELLTTPLGGHKVGPDLLRQPHSEAGGEESTLVVWEETGETCQREDIREPCRECKAAEAQSYCPHCQMLLCLPCDTDYHRLRLLRDHVRWAIGEAAKERRQKRLLFNRQ
eukprot:TRINITY_DN71207_c0_g1_i1.p1 TRINITY_DN71207_c0_g1~~TRINITY_DN71207_c0_g1_i1.p1  ORF type:complete len:551 (+),score=161.63 TRINITY_DN71207_c0_g1_i1:80-1654(+)